MSIAFCWSEWRRALSDDTRTDPHPPEIDASAERIELARAIASSLPKFGHWASTSRQFDTPYGQLGYRRISILWVLRHEIVDANRATATGLARFYRVQPSVLTRALANMETDGLITRTVDRNDNRIIRVAITELGLEVSRYVERMYIAEVLEAIRGLGNDEVEPLHRAVDCLDVIADELDQRRFGRSRRAERPVDERIPPADS